MHTMFGPNFNKNQLLDAPPNPRQQQIRSVIQDLSIELKLLQSRIASELQMNRLLVKRATQPPNGQSRMNFTPPQFNFCFQESTLGLQEIIVKKEDCQSSENHQKKIAGQQIKIGLKTNDSQGASEELRQKVKMEARQTLKLQQNLQSGPQLVHQKNETKNIPKNYGKAILSFIQKNIQKYLNVVRPILNKEKLTVSDLLNHIKKHKKQVNSIHYLKLMWGCQDINDPIFKCIRILSYTFMRKYCLSYIFNSRIKNYNTHIKYRKRMLQGIQDPAEFTCIKQF